MMTKNSINIALIAALLLLLAVAVATTSNSKKAKDKDGWSESYGEVKTSLIEATRLS